ncbi:MAG: AMP-binding protein [Myxococcota bacterium]
MSVETLAHLFEERVNRSGGRPALRYPSDVAWATQSWREWWTTCERVAAGLLELGVGHQERVGILAGTQVAWAWADLGALSIGAAVAPIYPSSTPVQCAAILRMTRPRVLFVGDPAQLSILHVPDALDSVLRIVVFDSVARSKGGARLELGASRPICDSSGRVIEVAHLQQLIGMGRRALSVDPERVARRRQRVAATDIATITSTSGTTGEPRGVRLSHGNLVAELEAIRRVELLVEQDLQLLALPLAHVFARTCLYASLRVGAQTAIIPGLDGLMRAMRAVRPTVFVGVPYVFERLASRMRARVVPERGPFSRPMRAVFRAASGLERRAEARGRLGEGGSGARCLYARVVWRVVAPVLTDPGGGH